MITNRIKLASVSFAVMFAAEIGVATLAHYELRFPLLAGLGVISALMAILVAAIGPEESEPHA